MMINAKAKDKAEYVNIWTAHIDQLMSLGWALDTNEDFEELKSAIEIIKKQLNNAADHCFDEELS